MVMVTNVPSIAHRDISVSISTTSGYERSFWLLQWVTIEEDHILNEGEIPFVLKSFLAAVYITPNGKDILQFTTWQNVARYSSCRDFRSRAEQYLEEPLMYAYENTGYMRERFFFLYDNKLIFMNNSGEEGYRNSFACGSVFEMELASFGNIMQGLDDEWHRIVQANFGGIPDWNERWSVSLSPRGVFARLDDHFNVERTYNEPPRREPMYRGSRWGAVK